VLDRADQDRGLTPSSAEGAAPAQAHGSAFRPDIEGLRALAILPILANHAGIPGFAGGFVGVDIFFVISGYLITRIIMRDRAEGRYSLAEFYRRRALRIFPALFVLLPVVTIVALLAMAPSELVTFSRSVIATTFFASNFHFLADTGYFTPAAATRPLLHTWSLAIEEQFYIFWPLVLAFALPRNRGARWGTVWAIVAASFVASIWMTRVDMAVAFYQLPFRAWELGLGGLLSALPLARLNRPSREVLSAAGLAAIGYATHFYREPLVFPGAAAALPCLGAAAIIAAGPQPLVNRLLALAPARFFGRISYSLYLWHWPVIVFAGLWLFLPAGGPTIAGEIAISVLLGWLSYELIEKNGRTWLAAMSRRTLFLTCAAVMIATGAFALALIATNGLPGRFTPQQRAFDGALDRNDQQAYRQGRCFMVEPLDRFDERTCLSGAPGRPQALLIGDSLAAHWWPGLSQADLPFSVLQATMVGCKPGLYAPEDRRPCARFFNRMLGPWLSGHKVQAVILAGRWQTSDLPLLDTTLARLRAAGQRTIVIGAVPIYRFALPRLLFFNTASGDPGAMARANLDRDASFAVDRAVAQVAARHHTPFISPLDALCPNGECRVLAAPSVPMQFDDAHFTVEGSRVAAEAIKPALTNLVTEASKN
jgi:peptidoglycan/LPS O-acetylase OafA/YrhL